MHIRHHLGNIYEVVDEEEVIVWYRGTYKKCQEYLRKNGKK